MMCQSWKSIYGRYKTLRFDFKQCEKYVTDISSVKGLGFCVSVAHANYMAKYFNDKGIPSIALSSKVQTIFEMMQNRFVKWKDKLYFRCGFV